MGRIILSICAVVVAGIVCAGLWIWLAPTNVPLTENQETSQPAGSYEPGGPECEPQRLAANADAVARKAKAHDCARARDQHRKDQADLDQQTRSADAAEAVAFFTYAQTRLAIVTALLTMISTGLIVWTLWETRQAAQREQRAYLRVDPAEGIVVPNKPVSIKLSIVNYGTTPARDVAFEHSTVIRARGWRWADEPGDPPNEAERTFVVVHPGSPMTAYMNMDDPLSPELHAAITDGTACVFGAGVVHYRDVFGNQRKTTVRLEFSGAECMKTGKLRVAGRGNDAT